MDRTVYFSHKKATCRIILWDEGNATVSNVFSINRGRGHANELLRMVVEYADEHGLDLVLEARRFGYSDNDSPNDAGLRRFYAKFGFVYVGDDMMQRKSRKLHGP